MIDLRASSAGMMHEYHVCTLCSRPPFCLGGDFGFCLLLRESQCAHVILSSILVWPNKVQNKVQIVAVSRGLFMGVQL